MAGAAVVREVRNHVIRVCRLLVLRLVALEAVDINQLVVAIRVTRLARRRNMSTCELKPRSTVVERCPLPCRRGMAGLTRCWEIGGNMIRVCCPLIICPVTGNAFGRQSPEGVALMT